MALINVNNIILSVMLPIFLTSTCGAIKCYDCNSANNSACLEIHVHRMRALVPLVECGASLPNVISKDFFCRKITQTILHIDKTPEVRITRGCGWVKHKRECYKADNSDHLETVCQCFDDKCNAATSLRHIHVTALGVIAALYSTYQSWRGRI